MLTVPAQHRTAVLGIGNPLCRDDGVGISVIDAMRSCGRHPGIDLLDGGTAPDLLSLLEEGTAFLIIVDALRGGGRPGDIYRLELREENISEDVPASLHGMGVLESLKLMRRLGLQVPRVVVIGIEPSDTSHGLGLSPAIGARLPELIASVESVLGEAD
jgi:hydrogenase maturation protease